MPRDRPPARPAQAQADRRVSIDSARVDSTAVKKNGPGRRALAAASLIGLVLLLYYPSLDGPFVFDDPNAISQSALIQRLRPLARFLTLSTRPLTDFSYALNYAQGGLDPRSFHATNIFLHVVNVLLVYLLALHTLELLWLPRPPPPRRLRRDQMRNRRRRDGETGTATHPGTEASRRIPDAHSPDLELVAWAAAAIFAAHPLASETVAYMSSRSEELVATFFLLTLLLYVTAASTRQKRVRIACVAGLPFCTAAALASKEIAVMIPSTLALYDWCFLARGDWQRTRGRWRLIGLTVVPLAAGSLVLLYRAYASGIALGSYAQTAGLGFDRFGRWQYLITELGVIVHYLRLVIWPVRLTFDYDWPLAQSFWTVGVLLPLALLVALVALAIRYVRTQPIFTFAVLTMLLILAPTSSILPIADLAVERRMYLPLIGLSLLAASTFWLLLALPQMRRVLGMVGQSSAFVALIAVPLLGLAVLTHERAALWGDAVALHEDGVAMAPRNPRVRLNLGVTYLNLNRLDEARIHLTKAKELYDSGESVHAFRRIGAFIEYNLGAVLFMQGDHEPASQQLKMSLKNGGEYLALRPMAMFILGRIAETREDWALAAARYGEAVRYSPRNAPWYVDLARAQSKIGLRKDAIASARHAKRLQPGNEAAQALLDEIGGRRPQQRATTPAKAESSRKLDSVFRRNDRFGLAKETLDALHERARTEPNGSKAEGSVNRSSP